MSSPDAPKLDADDPIAAAQGRLDAAIERVAQRLTALSLRVDHAVGEADAARENDVDRNRLADALDAAHAREAELLSAVKEAEASVTAALGELEPLLGASKTEGER
jgi:hypothetical protein